MTNQHPPIYKRSATGGVLTWRQEIHGNSYRTISGTLDGQLIVSEWRECAATNRGRSNERTAPEQAAFEVAANYKKRLERDYHKSIADIDKPLIFKPMLAHTYEGKRVEQVTAAMMRGDVYSQPKLDGMRCIATARGLHTRNGKPILSCPHIVEELTPLFTADPDLILDGELYNHDLHDDFNTIISAARKTKPNAADLEESARLIQYHIYDMPSHEGVFSERIQAIPVVFDNADSFPSIRLVSTSKISSAIGLNAFYDDYLTDGYEGQMIRLNTLYENKRSGGLLKRKETQSGEFVVLDIQSGVGNWAGKAKRVVLAIPDGSTCEAGVTGTAKHCADILMHKADYIGQPATVEYFGVTPDGKLRFGRVKEFNRNDV